MKAHLAPDVLRHFAVLQINQKRLDLLGFLAPDEIDLLDHAASHADNDGDHNQAKTEHDTREFQLVQRLGFVVCAGNHLQCLVSCVVPAVFQGL